MSMTAPPRVPGRPKDLHKRAAIIAAAQTLFLTSDFENVTMEQVASTAHVAKMTVYGHFHDKETLFEAMVAAHSDSMFAPLATLPVVDGKFEDVMVAFGCTFLGLVLSPEIVGCMHRLVEALSRNRPLAERFYAAGPGRMRIRLAAFIGDAVARGDLAVDTAAAAAGDLLSLWIGDLQQVLALGLMAPLTQVQVEDRVRRGVRVFLRAYGTK